LVAMKMNGPGMGPPLVWALRLAVQVPWCACDR
jgi:hypothetical protein